MSRTLLMPAAVVASLFLSSPALAQHRGSGSAPAASRGVSRTAIVRTAPARGFPSITRTYAGPSRVFSPGHVVYAQSRGGHGGAGARGTAVVRGGGPYVAPRGVYVPRGGYYGRAYVAPYRYRYPYYTFRPRFSIGFGLWAGYPVSFSYGFYYGYPYAYAPYYAYPPQYSYPYAYPPPAAYGYPAPYSMNGYPPSSYPASGYPSSSYPATGYPSSSYPTSDYPPQPAYADPNGSQNAIVAQAGTAAGSISFEITPTDAAVIIDGTYVGRVSDLGPTSQPMGLKPGRHHVEIRASGYQTLTFDADVVAGQVLPYQGQMQPIR